jgi:hypothetical protein
VATRFQCADPWLLPVAGTLKMCRHNSLDTLESVTGASIGLEFGQQFKTQVEVLKQPDTNGISFVSLVECGAVCSASGDIP